MPEVTGEPDPAAGPEREEMRALVAAALTGLNPGDREVIELNLRHTLDDADLADALGVSRNQAHALVSRARSQFEGSLGALLVARAGREACPGMDEILAGWDGELTILLRQRVNRHIEDCEVCSERKRRELSPAMLLSMLPMVALPAALREQVFRLVVNRSPSGVGYRDLVVHRAAPFSHSGFPRPIESPRRIYGVRTMAAAASVAIIAAALLGTGTVFVLECAEPQGRDTGQRGDHRPDRGPGAHGIRLAPGQGRRQRYQAPFRQRQWRVGGRPPATVTDGVAARLGIRDRDRDRSRRATRSRRPASIRTHRRRRRRHRRLQARWGYRRAA